MNRRALLLACVLGVSGCGGAQKAGVATDAKADVGATADEILQGRLRVAVRDLDKTLAVRALPAVGTVVGVTGRLTPKEIQRVVRTSFGRFRLCYEDGLRRDRNLRGRVSVSFTIDLDGSVSYVRPDGRAMPDALVTACVGRAIGGLVFPAPAGGVVTVTYPLVFDPGDDPPPESSPPAPVLEPPDPEGPWPIVVVDGRSIVVDGEVVGDVRGVIASGKLQKIDALFDALKRQRERWKAGHPGKRYPGVAGVRVGRDLPMLVFKSVFQTMAYAGLPHILVQRAEQPAVVLDLAARVPGPPGPADGGHRADVVLQVQIFGSDLILDWKRGATIVRSDRVPRAGTDLAKVLCDAWHRQVRRDQSDGLQDPLVLRSQHDLPFEEAAKVLRAVESCTRDVRLPGGQRVRRAAFWTMLSVH